VRIAEKIFKVKVRGRDHSEGKCTFPAEQGCGVAVWVLARSQSLSFEGDSDSGPCLSHLDFYVIYCSYLTFV